MKKNVCYFGLILLGIWSRLMPHPPNFTALAAVAFFAADKIPNKKIAFAIPLITLALSDAVLGWHSTLPFVYLGFILTGVLGLRFGASNAHRALGLAASSVSFFLISNFGVWLTSGLYPRHLAGLAACYTAAIPFFRNEFLGTLLYGGAFYLVSYWVEKSERAASAQEA
ncbi:MAG: hypothetical protein HY401_04845 [Elusimicrobia bacterium]|nr:hypothetical protein [Elusimicrobiota bacterium]